ncbi:o-antigen flippase Wzx [Aquipluma nitroreducens]|uniref:O-antigen flippase Wzx n=1 Tax=Aquipluma nitroreducens TaxID=2010828 RepID=A0A5K7SGB1_9BACT|nr:oligosaccharide flippase family protein [Aquipluma nitroreducens]BBE20583.1 o-antigen flippase Wzx [Aquipluma nitroreducens]
MNRYIQIILNFFTKGHERSIKAKKNILASFLVKGLSIAISLVLVPLTINYINPSRYGIWLTVSSIVGWFVFFDIGLTQGLRNKFAEAKAKDNNELAQIYVSTTYAILAIIFFIVWIIFLIVNHFLNWANILNISESMRSEVSILVIIVFTYFCLQFVLKIISTLFLANQQPAKSSLIDVIGQLFSLIFIFILIKTTEGSLINLGVALCASPILVLVGANVFFFNGEFKKYRPSFTKIKFSYAKDLFNLGLIFFVIQIAGIIQFQTANIIIARNFGTADVTSYNIVLKYFGVLDMISVIFLMPFWSASTEAYLKNDIKWIKNAVKNYNRLNIIWVIISCVMFILSENVYRLWLGEGKVIIGFYLSFWGFLFINVKMFYGKYVYLLNGINALRLQFWACLISPLIYIAVAIMLITYFKMGVYALFVASIIANFNGYFLAPLQYHMVINKNKKGIWIK